MNKRIVIIDYRMGNVASVEKAFRKFGVKTSISRQIKEIERADFLVLPGVGAFGDGMNNLKSLDLIEILNRKVLEDKTPFLGICLGMQLLAQEGQEFGTNNGLGWIKGMAVKLETKNLRLPHVGWNEIQPTKNGGLLRDLPDKNFYFVHSYHLKTDESKIITSYCRYGEKFASSIQKGNIFATQFHPEKSQTAGLKIIGNFLNEENIAKN